MQKCLYFRYYSNYAFNYLCTKNTGHKFAVYKHVEKKKTVFDYNFIKVGHYAQCCKKKASRTL